MLPLSAPRSGRRCLPQLALFRRLSGRPGFRNAHRAAWRRITTWSARRGHRRALHCRRRRGQTLRSRRLRSIDGWGRTTRCHLRTIDRGRDGPCGRLRLWSGDLRTVDRRRDASRSALRTVNRRRAGRHIWFGLWSGNLRTIDRRRGGTSRRLRPVDRWYGAAGRGRWQGHGGPCGPRDRDFR